MVLKPKFFGACWFNPRHYLKLIGLVLESKPEFKPKPYLGD